MDKKELLNITKNLKLTKKERRVLEFFLDEDERVYLMTVSEIAKEIDVSDTTVIRFIKNIGFKDFTEFKNKGQRKIKTHLDKTSDFIKNIDLLKENSIEKLYVDKINEDINKIFNTKSLKNLKNIAHTLIDKRQKYIIGFKSTAGIANFFGIRLGFILENVSVFNIDDSVVVNSVFNIKSEDILVVFDYPMYSKVAKVITKIAKENKASVILFSDSDTSPLRNYCDIFYKVNLKGMSIFNSMISSQILIEYIITYISQFLDETKKERFINIKKYLIEKL